MNLNTPELLLLPFLLAFVLIFIPIITVRIFFYLPTWIKIRGWKNLAENSNLTFLKRVKTGYFSHLGITIFSLTSGSYKNKALYAFSVVPYYHRLGRTSYTWVNGTFYKTLKAKELDLVLSDTPYKQLIPKGLEFNGCIIPVGVSTSEFLVIFSGIIFLKHGVFIPLEAAKKLWFAGRKYYASKASTKQIYFAKDGGEEDLNIIYNNDEACDFYTLILKESVDSEAVKVFFDTYQDFINQTGKTVPVDLDSLIGGFKLTKFFSK